MPGHPVVALTHRGHGLVDAAREDLVLLGDPARRHVVPVSIKVVEGHHLIIGQIGSYRVRVSYRVIRVIPAPLGDQLLRDHRVHALLEHAVVLPVINYGFF